VEPGQALTEGSLNPHRVLRIQGREACQLYLMSEVQKVYRSQGQNIHDKHFEVIIRKMMSKVQVTRPGDTKFLPGDAVDRLEIRKINEQLLADGKQPAKFSEVLLGVTKASLSTDSFLSASSFQHTIKVLAGAAIGSTTDPLFGLKENVIIGKLIPAGAPASSRDRFADLEAERKRFLASGRSSSDTVAGAMTRPIPIHRDAAVSPLLL
jgi:DNA-directed RNA polymerase subunit beta'